MNQSQFDEKWSRFIVDGFGGMEIDIPEVIHYMDKEFEAELKENGEFDIFQIKLKFGKARVYTSCESERSESWEEGINEIIERT